MQSMQERGAEACRGALGRPARAEGAREAERAEERDRRAGRRRVGTRAGLWDLPSVCERNEVWRRRLRGSWRHEWPSPSFFWIQARGGCGSCRGRE